MTHVARILVVASALVLVPLGLTVPTGTTAWVSQELGQAIHGAKRIGQGLDQTVRELGESLGEGLRRAWRAVTSLFSDPR